MPIKDSVINIKMIGKIFFKPILFNETGSACFGPSYKIIKRMKGYLYMRHWNGLFNEGFTKKGDFPIKYTIFSWKGPPGALLAAPAAWFVRNGRQTDKGMKITIRDHRR